SSDLPTEYLSTVIDLCKKKRGIHVRVDYIDSRRCMAVYQMPLSEIVVDFYDKLKSYTRGYGSLEYRIIGYRPGDLVKLDIMLNGESVDALSVIVLRDNDVPMCMSLASNMRTLITRQHYKVNIQEAIGGYIIVNDMVLAHN